MKPNIPFILLMFCLSNIKINAQPRTDDYFPLAVGNSWIYNYSITDWEQLGDYILSDSGLASYTVVSKSVTTDSIIWNMQEQRNVVHHYRTTFPPLHDTIYAVNDTTAFQVIDYQKNDHRLVAYFTNWKSVFYLGGMLADSNAMFRYYPNQLNDTFTVSFKQYFNQGSVAQIYNASFKRNIGLTTVGYSAPGFTGWVPKTYHTLKSSFITSVGSNEVITSPLDFNLKQNYPNPFNPMTSIDFENSKKSKIKISIYDALGRLTETIFNGEVEIGKHSIHWNAKHYSSGVYFCVAQTKEQTKTIRLVLIK